MSDHSALAERVALACRVLARLDLTRAATGHVSARIPGQDRMLVRARGSEEKGVRYTSDQEVIEVDFNGHVIGPTAHGLAAPQEIFIHSEIYKARPDVYSVIHMHPPTVVLFTICCKPLLPLYGAYDPAGARMAIEGFPTFNRSILINNPDLGTQLAQTLGQSNVCLMKGHGVTSTGSSVEDAAITMIRLNDLASMNYQCQLLGDPQPIDQADQDVIMASKSAPRSASHGHPPVGADAALWRYYCEVTQSLES
ncbi:MAG: class II aldolase/adducin family protein [Methylocystaceae bacterium]|nr:class II aldolase/adducin family protein [Methylocystaceae bacterium]